MLWPIYVTSTVQSVHNFREHNNSHCFLWVLCFVNFVPWLKVPRLRSPRRFPRHFRARPKHQNKIKIRNVYPANQFYSTSLTMRRLHLNWVFSFSFYRVFSFLFTATAPTFLRSYFRAGLWPGFRFAGRKVPLFGGFISFLDRVFYLGSPQVSVTPSPSHQHNHKQTHTHLHSSNSVICCAQRFSSNCRQLDAFMRENGNGNEDGDGLGS